MNMNIPNLLTLARLFLLIPICLLMMGGFTAHVIAFVLYAVAAATDYLDGWWARTFNQGSDFGRMLDPIVDKVFVAGLFVMMAYDHTISGLMLFCPIIILAREFIVSGAREYLGPRGITIPVSKLAKWKTTIQMVSLGLLLIPVGFFHVLGIVTLLAATVLTVVTAHGYLRNIKFEN